MTNVLYLSRKVVSCLSHGSRLHTAIYINGHSAHEATNEFIREIKGWAESGVFYLNIGEWVGTKSVYIVNIISGEFPNVHNRDL